MKTNAFSRRLPLVARGLFSGAAVGFAAVIAASPAQAAFHLWNIRELYTDSSGSRQFVELFVPFSGENFVTGQQISVRNVGATQTHTFTVSGNALPGNTLNRTLLFGTAGLRAAGGPVPDYIIPDNFLFAAGGSITFFGFNSGTYTALPTDGSLSRTWTGGNEVNSPRNYAGQTGTVTVPEPAAPGLVALGGLGFLFRTASKQSLTFSAKVCAGSDFICDAPAPILITETRRLPCTP